MTERIDRVGGRDSMEIYRIMARERQPDDERRREARERADEKRKADADRKRAARNRRPSGPPPIIDIRA